MHAGVDSKVDLSVILPMYKPSNGWQMKLQEHIYRLQMALGNSIKVEYIVVNDGFENTATLQLFEEISAENPRIKFISYSQNKGKGYALRQGAAHALAPYCITTDFDFPYDFDNVAKVYQYLTDGYDVVTGKRNQTYFEALPFKRHVISKGSAFLIKTFLGLPSGDTQSGLKGFNNKGRNIFLNTTIDRYLIDTEFLVLAKKSKAKVRVTNVNLRQGIQFSSMGMGTLWTELKNFYRILSTKQFFLIDKIQEQNDFTFLLDESKAKKKTTNAFAEN